MSVELALAAGALILIVAWRRRRRRPCRVTVIYKNGRRVRFRCARFASARSTLDGELTRVSWTDARPEPFQFGVDEVAAIYVRKGLL